MVSEGVAPPTRQRLLRLQQERRSGHQRLRQLPFQVRSAPRGKTAQHSGDSSLPPTSIHRRFMGNSSAAIMDGEAVLYFLRIPGESYTITFPTAYARGSLASIFALLVREETELLFCLRTGILWGTLLMEMGGTVYITCEKTGLQSEIEFKTKVRNQALLASTAIVHNKSKSSRTLEAVTTSWPAKSKR